MKTTSDIQILQDADLSLTIDPSLAGVLGIGPRNILYCAALRLKPERDAARRADPIQPFLTLVATPFPTPSWPNLLRFSITIQPLPGTLYQLAKALNNLHLYCRSIEFVNNIDLHSYSLIPGTSTEQSMETSPSPPSSRPRLIPSSAIVVIEVPPDTSQSSASASRSRVLILELRNLLSETSQPTTKAKQALQQALREALNQQPNTTDHDDLTVHWVSPMLTLNHLFRSSPIPQAPSMHRQVVAAPEPYGTLVLSLEPWRRVLWPRRSVIPDTETTEREPRILVLGQADSDEKILYWHFFRSLEHVIIEFEMLHPSRGLESFWWNYIFDNVRTARGNILTATSRGRLDGHWGTLSVCAVFPFSYQSGNDQEDVKAVIDCFRNLQCDTSDQDEFPRFARELEQSYATVSGDLQALPAPVDAESSKKDPGTSDDPPRSTRSKSTLRSVRIWDPRAGRQVRNYHSSFASNPYSFTAPLDLAGYHDLYNPKTDDKPKPGTRYRLADRIIERLERGENIAIVGAHRAGKTTVLNLVHDSLQAKETAKIDLAVRINASTVPPYSIVPTLALELERHKGQGRGTRLANRVRKLLLRDLPSLLNRLSLEQRILGTTVKIVEAEGAKPQPGTADSTATLLRDLNWALDTLPSHQGMRFLSASLDKLQQALADPSHDSPATLVVILDEVGKLSDWGKEEFLQVWRHVIESRRYRNLRWLISASRPIAGSAELSPITNVFKEYNVGSLEDEEARGLLDAFSSRSQVGGAGKEHWRPVLTYPARVFLREVTSSLPYFLQVALYHLYDRATRAAVPIANRILCEHVLRHEVLGEVSDYLEYQWGQIPEDVQSWLLTRLRAISADPASVFGPSMNTALQDRDPPPGYEKALIRAGLKGNDSLIVAPIVALWLITTEVSG